MNNYSKAILTILFLGLFILTCKKKEEEQIPAFDFRTDLVGTYIVLCTKHQYHPYLGPGTSYPTDTSDVDKAIEVSFDSNDLLVDNTNGIIKIDGKEFNIRKDSTGIRYAHPSPGHLSYHTGKFILPDTINYSWNDVYSEAAFTYGCKGVKM